MIIGIDASRANREQKTGTEWYSYHLIRNLAKIDSHNQYILYTNTPLKGGLVDLEYPDDLNQSNIPAEIEFDSSGFQRLKSPHGNFKGKVLRWPSRYFWSQGRLSLEMVLSRPDVLFVPAHALPFIHPKNSVVTIHDIGFMRDQRLYDKEAMGSEFRLGRYLIDVMVRLSTRGRYGANATDYLYWSTNHAMKESKRIITISDFTRSELEKEYAKFASKIKVVYNGYNTKLFRPVTEDAKIDQVLKHYDIKKPYFVYNGRLEKKKNVAALVQAFAFLRERDKSLPHQLVLAGKASYGFDEIRQLVDMYNLDRQVIMTGWMEEDDLPYVYAGAQAFLFPSLYEGFGMPIIQAMACGTPTVVSDVPSLREVSGGNSLFFDPLSIRSIRDAMDRISKDEVVRADLMAKGLEWAKRFSWAKCAEETLAVLEETGR